jgi:hypothetical protein
MVGSIKDNMKSLYQKIMAVRRGVAFRKMKDTCGWCFVEDHKSPIFINLNIIGEQDPAITYIHECLHIIYPTKEEDEILKLEEKVWKTLTARQRFLLSRKLFNRKWRTE